jgi:hypothetical protein
VIVPVSALVPNGEAMQVFTVDADSIAHATPVTVGGRSDTEAEILSGLRGGETVVTGGAYGVTDSAKIVVPKATVGEVDTGTPATSASDLAFASGRSGRFGAPGRVSNAYAAAKAHAGPTSWHAPRTGSLDERV